MIFWKFWRGWILICCTPYGSATGQSMFWKTLDHLVIMILLCLVYEISNPFSREDNYNWCLIISSHSQIPVGWHSLAVWVVRIMSALSFFCFLSKNWFPKKLSIPSWKCWIQNSTTNYTVLMWEYSLAIVRLYCIWLSKLAGFHHKYFLCLTSLASCVAHAKEKIYLNLVKNLNEISQTEKKHVKKWSRFILFNPNNVINSSRLLFKLCTIRFYDQSHNNFKPTPNHSRIIKSQLQISA